ncbi:hypothetical protein ACLOJK_021816, partial [Asimina triloba]
DLPTRLPDHALFPDSDRTQPLLRYVGTTVVFPYSNRTGPVLRYHCPLPRFRPHPPTRGLPRIRPP